MVGKLIINHEPCKNHPFESLKRGTVNNIPTHMIGTVTSRHNLPNTNLVFKPPHFKPSPQSCI